MIAFVALALGYTVWMKRRAKSALDGSKPAFESFFQRTGYRYPDLLSAPPAAQADRAMFDARNPKPGGYQLHYVRDYHGIRIHYESAYGMRQEGSKSVYFYSNAWEAEVPHAVGVPLHIADKALDSTLKAAKELFSNSRRVFTPKGSQRIQTGIAELDANFVVFGDDPAAVQAVFHANPALVQALSGWAELDVSIVPGRAVFADPNQHNMNAAMGGAVGSMALGFDYAKRLELGIPVHDRVADLLALLSRATASVRG